MNDPLRGPSNSPVLANVNLTRLVQDGTGRRLWFVYNVETPVSESVRI
jgi:hypothetical protein